MLKFTRINGKIMATHRSSRYVVKQYIFKDINAALDFFSYGEF